METISSLLDIYLSHDYFGLREAKKFVNDNDLSNSEVSIEIAELINALAKNKEIPENDFEIFHKQIIKLKEENPKFHDVIVGIVNRICISAVYSADEDREKIVTEIEETIKQGKELSFPATDNLAKYRGILNIYHLTKGTCLSTDEYYGLRFPGITTPQEEIITYNLPFIINALMISNQLPKTKFLSIDLSKPIYPNTQQDTKPRLEIKRGIKDSDTYYPFKKNKKIAKGDTGDTTYMATNGKKILYLRDISRENYRPNSILASKVAAFVSKENFSTERLLDSRIVGSRSLEQYHVSAADDQITTARMDYIVKQKKVFPGTGTVDEVLNFIQEWDLNTENFGFSSKDLSKAHISKIDFDCCDVSRHIESNDYENDILTHRRGIYHALEHVKKDPNYIKEKLSARIKLAIMPDKLFLAMAEKAYANQEDEKVKAVNELVNRTKIALELFTKNNHAKEFLEESPNILNKIREDSVKYIIKNFDKKDQKEIIASLDKRMEEVRRHLNTELKVQLADHAQQEQKTKPVVTKQVIPPPRPSGKDIDTHQLQSPAQQKVKTKVQQPKPLSATSKPLTRQPSQSKMVKPGKATTSTVVSGEMSANQKMLMDYREKLRDITLPNNVGYITQNAFNRLLACVKSPANDEKQVINCLNQLKETASKISESGLKNEDLKNIVNKLKRINVMPETTSLRRRAPVITEAKPVPKSKVTQPEPTITKEKEKEKEIISTKRKLPSSPEQSAVSSEFARPAKRPIGMIISQNTEPATKEMTNLEMLMQLRENINKIVLSSTDGHFTKGALNKLKECEKLPAKDAKEAHDNLVKLKTVAKGIAIDNIKNAEFKSLLNEIKEVKIMESPKQTLTKRR